MVELSSTAAAALQRSVKDSGMFVATECASSNDFTVFPRAVKRTN